VFTGAGFYDPVDELLIEPALPGISYSFTEDGYFEEATYQVTSNAKNHSCPSAALTFQHGTYTILSNGSLQLTPFEVDGRQLVSDPCEDGGISTYNRYNQSEFYIQYTVAVDPYHGRYKLSLYQWDGTPTQPLYLAYRPPMMLPTETLNPTATGDAATASASATATSNEKRSLRSLVRRRFENRDRTNAVRKSGFDHQEFWWWGSIGMISLGSVLYAYF
jgi:hypothetical protein